MKFIYSVEELKAGKHKFCKDEVELALEICEHQYAQYADFGFMGTFIRPVNVINPFYLDQIEAFEQNSQNGRVV